eukprot:g1896.t1
MGAGGRAFAYAAAQKKEIYRIVFTGGPCGGKTSAMALLTQRLNGFGLGVYRVPEAATLLMNAGASWTDLSEEQIFVQQQQIANMQLALEDAMCNIAASSGKKRNVVLCDRGVLDGKAYMPEHLWRRLVDSRPGGFAEHELAERYDCVVHLTTAAIGAEKYYTLANNAARRENLQEAAELDRKVRDCWVGSSNVSIVRNPKRGGFDAKMARAVTEICKIVGVPAPSETRKYFEVEAGASQAGLSRLEATHSIVELTYVQPAADAKRSDSGDAALMTRLQRRIFIDSAVDVADAVQRGYASRLQDGKAICSDDPFNNATAQNMSTYSLRTLSVVRNPPSVTSSFRQLQPRDFAVLARQKLRNSIIVRQWRRTFTWNERLFELDVIVDPPERRGTTKLSVECSDEADYADVLKELPPFLRVTKEVTNDPRFRSYYFATGKPPKHME